MKITPANQKGKFLRSRSILTKEQAREIFLFKQTQGDSKFQREISSLAHQYKISSKAIRDIWKGRSWLDATYDLWSTDSRPPKRVLGRPKGKKDTKPRKSKQQFCLEGLISASIDSEDANHHEKTSISVVSTTRSDDPILSSTNLTELYSTSGAQLRYELITKVSSSYTSAGQFLPPIRLPVLISGSGCNVSSSFSIDPPLPGIEWLLRGNWQY